MTKEAVTLEIEIGDIRQAQRLANEQGLTVKQWMEEVVRQAVTQDSPAPTPQAPRSVTRR